MLEFRSQSLQDTELPVNPLCRFWFDLIEGLPNREGPAVRGEDVVAPGRKGQYAGNRVADHLDILVEGWIRGIGATPEERSESWAESSDLILAVFQRDDTAGTLTVGPGPDSYLGLASDWSIQVRCIDPQPGPITSHMSYQRWSFKLRSIWQDEAFWVEAESS